MASGVNINRRLVFNLIRYLVCSLTRHLVFNLIRHLVLNLIRHLMFNLIRRLGFNLMWNLLSRGGQHKLSAIVGRGALIFSACGSFWNTIYLKRHRCWSTCCIVYSVAGDPRTNVCLKSVLRAIIKLPHISKCNSGAVLKISAAAASLFWATLKIRRI